MKCTKAAKIVSTTTKVVSTATTFTMASAGVVSGAKNIYNNIKNGEIFTKENALEAVSLGLNIFTAGQAGKSLSKVGKSFAGNSAKKWSEVKETTSKLKTDNRGILYLGKNGSNVKEFDIVEYNNKTPEFENHHGVLDIWATHNIDGYKSRASKSTTIALTKPHHNATKAEYREWLFEKTGRRVGGSVDWKNVSPREIQALSERMFDAANVPVSARNDYYREFNRYIYGLKN